MTVTVDLDETIVERAREVAKEYGTSLEAMLREFTQGLALDKMTPAEIAMELRRLSAMGGGHSGGQKWTREEMHERKNVR
ncbi:MAG TPA: hypothetical protein VI670_28805 [Thermoanaerobaculia bacterium]|jgi:gamma-glutamyl:cysteine ligase YbdK (ATP-grasp superfamily)